MSKDKKWVAYGRSSMSAYGNQWVRIASGRGEYQKERTKAWFKYSYDELKFEES